MSTDGAEKWLTEHGFERDGDNCYARHGVEVWRRDGGWTAVVAGWTRRESTPAEAIGAAAAAVEAHYAASVKAVAEARAILGAP